jgi:hypothetical protein
MIIFDSSLTNPAFSSTITRLNSLLNSFNTILKNPLFGVGYNFYYFPNGTTFVMNLVTFLNWIVLFGIPFGLFYISSYVSIFLKKRQSFFLSLFIIFTHLIFISSQDLHRNMVLLIIIFYGFNKLVVLRNTL